MSFGAETNDSASSSPTDIERAQAIIAGEDSEGAELAGRRFDDEDKKKARKLARERREAVRDQVLREHGQATGKAKDQALARAGVAAVASMRAVAGEDDGSNGAPRLRHHTPPRFYCKYGMKCWKRDCGGLHPKPRRFCPDYATCPAPRKCTKGMHPPRCFKMTGDDKKCEDDNCPYWHAYCAHGNACWLVGCYARHPKGFKRCPEGKVCPDPKSCTKGTHPPPCGENRWMAASSCQKQDTCQYWHPQKMAPCPFGYKCGNVECMLEHPKGRRLCPKGAQCDDENCQEGSHPPDCRNGAQCMFATCRRRHPKHWKACPLGNKCPDPLTCPNGKHPPACLKQPNCRDRNCLFSHDVAVYEDF